jgi:hypothetical protein
MKLSFGFVEIDYTGTDEEVKKLKYNGQICVDGIETFIVKYELGGEHKIFPYGKREFVVEQVKDHYGEELNNVLDKLAIEKSAKIKADKKTLANLRRLGREKAKSAESKNKKSKTL